MPKLELTLAVHAQGQLPVGVLDRYGRLGALAAVAQVDLARDPLQPVAVRVGVRVHVDAAREQHRVPGRRQQQQQQRCRDDRRGRAEVHGARAPAPGGEQQWRCGELCIWPWQGG